MGVLPGHAPLLTVLGAGELAYRVGSVWGYLAVAGGFAEVLRSSVSVLAETAERPEEIDEAQALRDKEEAEAAQRTETTETGQRRAQESLDRALARLKVRVRN
jgi:F-type H+-transporting ATPase subunit epsilon